jgi:hydroxymethylglutaryl-CoA reductase
MSEKTSRLPGFYKLPPDKRARVVASWANLNDEEQHMLTGDPGLTLALADKMIENVAGVFALPLGIAANFRIDGRDVLVPMAVEEPSVVAAASHMAKLARAGGGFRTSSTPPEMIGQIQVLDLDDLDAAAEKVLAAKDELMEIAACCDKMVVELGGGPRDVEVRALHDTAAGPIERITGGRVGLRILSNLADRRLARAECTIPADVLGFDDFPGEVVAARIVEAWAFAAADPYRAATHNKGIMNGIDPVVIATGNDWRAVEAGAHAYAARSGRYTSLSTWGLDEQGNLTGSLELPMPVGIVGGATRVHPVTRIALKILGVESARELAQIIVAVGLAQNLGALRALATEGIQKGHMALHARQIAIAAGATGEQVEQLVAQMLETGQINLAYAQELLREAQA